MWLMYSGGYAEPAVTLAVHILFASQNTDRT